MPIDPIIPIGIPKDMVRPLSSGSDEATPGANFTDYLKKSMGDVNELLNSADKKASDLAVGRSENLHDASIAMEKAETALKLLVQVRNKALDAYHEIMRMQL